MKSLVFNPSPLIDEVTKEKRPDSFEGEVLLKALSLKESAEICRGYGLKLNLKGQMDIKDHGDDFHAFIEKLGLIAKDIVVEMNLWRMIGDEKVEYKCVDDLGYDADGRNVIVEIGTLGMNGARPGKNCRIK